MKENVIKNKRFDFAVRIVELYQFLVEDKKEYILSKQLLRSGTSVGAMVRESEFAETKKDFIHKMAITQKETNYLSSKQFESVNNDAIEIIKLITSIIKTAKLRLNTKH